MRSEREGTKKKKKKGSSRRRFWLSREISRSLALFTFRRSRGSLSRAPFSSLPRRTRALRLRLGARGENGPVAREAGRGKSGRGSLSFRMKRKSSRELKRTGGGRRLAGSLGGELLARGLAARGLASRLLRTSHCKFGWGFWGWGRGGREG